MEKNWITKDSGERQEYFTGSRRDTQKGKGRFDLLPWEIVKKVAKEYAFLHHADWGSYVHIAQESMIGWFLGEFQERALVEAAACIVAAEYGFPDTPKIRPKDYYLAAFPPEALARWAGLMERGAEKYGNRNWERGQPHSRWFDSGMRHLSQWRKGQDDEDHFAAILFNLAGAVYVTKKIEEGKLPEELDDRPKDNTVHAKPEPSVSLAV